MMTRKGFFGALLGAVGGAFGSRFLSEPVDVPLDPQQPVQSIPSVWTSGTTTTSTVTVTNNDGTTWVLWPGGAVSTSDNLARYEAG